MKLLFKIGAIIIPLLLTSGLLLWASLMLAR
jgi:hypothetical protein